MMPKRDHIRTTQSSFTYHVSRITFHENYLIEEVFHV
jgi:hypothetical protein